MFILIKGLITQEIVDEVMRWSVTPEMQQVKAHVSVPRPNPDGTYPENAFIRITGFFREPGEIEIEIPPKLIRAQQEDKISIDIGGTAVEPQAVDESSVGVCLHQNPKIIRITDNYILLFCGKNLGDNIVWGYFDCQQGTYKLFKHVVSVEGNKITYRCKEVSSGNVYDLARENINLLYDILKIWSSKILIQKQKKSG